MALTTALDDAAWQGPWRRVRVGEKVALCGGLLVTALVAPPWPGGVLTGVACLALTCGAARIPARTLALALAAPLSFLVIGGASVAIVAGGAPPPDALVWGPLWADPASMARGGTAFCRGVAGTLAVLMLGTTTPMVDLLTWLRRLGVPAPLTDIASLTYRLLFVLLSTALALRAAQTARLGRPSLTTAAQTAGTLLVRSWDRAARLQAGLEGRGYVDDLPTLPAARAASVPFVAATVGVLAVIWGAVALAGVR